MESVVQKHRTLCFVRSVLLEFGVPSLEILRRKYLLFLFAYQKKKAPSDTQQILRKEIHKNFGEKLTFRVVSC